MAERQQVPREQAAGRRREHRVQCGQTLQAMRDRGESAREIARLAGVAEKTARELIREADVERYSDGPSEAAAAKRRELGEPVPRVNVMARERMRAGAPA